MRLSCLSDGQARGLFVQRRLRDESVRLPITPTTLAAARPAVSATEFSRLVWLPTATAFLAAALASAFTSAFTSASTARSAAALARTALGRAAFRATLRRSAFLSAALGRAFG